MVDEMLTNKILLILVAVFTKTTEQTLKKIQLNNQKTELAFCLEKWTKKLSNTLAARS